MVMAVLIMAILIAIGLRHCRLDLWRWCTRRHDVIVLQPSSGRDVGLKALRSRSRYAWAGTDYARVLARIVMFTMSTKQSEMDDRDRVSNNERKDGKMMKKMGRHGVADLLSQGDTTGARSMLKNDRGTRPDRTEECACRDWLMRHLRSRKGRHPI